MVKSKAWKGNDHPVYYTRMKKNTWLTRFFTSRWFVISTLVIIGGVGFSFFRTYYLHYTIKARIGELEKQVMQLDEKELELMEVLDYVASDAFVEEKARTELGLKKPGEQMIVVKNDRDYRHRDVSQDSSQELLSNPKKWWYYFTHKPLPTDV